MKEEYEEYLKTLDKDEKLYICHRVINQIEWYDKKACEKQSRYKWFSIAVIIINSVIPVLALFTEKKYGFKVSVAVTVLSGSAAIINSVLLLCEYQRLWVQYRTNCEILKSNLYRYLTKSGEYSVNSGDRFDLLVKNTECLLTDEFKKWAQINQRDDKIEKL